MVARYLLAIAAAASLAAAAAAGEAPSWAYPVDPPGETSAPDNGAPLSVPDSKVAFTRTQLDAIDGPVSDWHPREHPQMPDVVGRGRPPQSMPAPTATCQTERVGRKTRAWPA